MRPLKIAGLAVGAVLVVAVGGALVASRFAADYVKLELAKVMQEKKQRTLKIDGKLEFRFWPSVGIELGKLSLSEHGSAREFASIETARVAVAVQPLLERRVVVDTVEVSGLRAAIVRHKDGTLNIDDLLAQDQTASAPLQLDVAGIKLADAQLSWRDEKSGGTTTLAGLELAAGRVQADTGSKTARVETLTLAGRGKTAGGEFGLKLALSGIEATNQAVTIARLALDADAKPGAAVVKGTLAAALAADAGRRTLTLEKLAGDIDIAHPQLPAKHLKLPLSGALRVDLAKPSASGHLATQFDGSKAALKFDVARFAPLALGFDLDIDRLDVDKYLPKKPGGKPADAGKFDLSALQDIELDGMARIGSLRAAGVEATNVRLQIRAAHGKLDIVPRAAGKLGLAGNPLAAIGSEAKQQVKGLPGK